MRKLRHVEELPALLEGKKVVLANGSFDLLHAGHLRYLQGAKQLGEVLVVAINSDSSVRATEDDEPPILNQAERVTLVSALSCVDYVVVFDEPDVSRVLDLLRPAVHAKDDPRNDATRDIIAGILEKAEK